MMGHQSSGNPSVRTAVVELVRSLMILHGLTLEELGLAASARNIAPKLSDAPSPAPAPALSPVSAATPAHPSPLQQRAVRINRRTDLGSFAVKPCEAPRSVVVEHRDGVKITVCPSAHGTRFAVDPDFKGGEFMADWRRRRGG